MLSDQELTEIWKNESYEGAFSGGRNFQKFLKTQFNENISLARIYRILKTIPAYVVSQRPIRRFPMRHYDIGGRCNKILQICLISANNKNI